MSYLNELENLRATNRLQRNWFSVTIGVAVLGMYLLSRGPHEVDVHMVNNMRAANTISVVNGVAPVPRPNVYGFAFYTLQSVNRWASDGSREYGQQIYSFQHFVTPRCRDFLEMDMKHKSARGELGGRTRAMSEVPGNAYSDNRVIPNGDNAWTVYLDMQMTETMRGQVVKDISLRYPMRVVRYDVDRLRNPWQLALDCSASTEPDRLEPVTQPQAGGRGAPAKFPAVPSTPPEPAPLPGVVSPQRGTDARPVAPAAPATPAPLALPTTPLAPTAYSTEVMQ